MSRVAVNTFWLFLSQLGGIVIPLVELPVLARALGPYHYGLVLYTVGVSLTASVFVEFGFNFSGARAVVRASRDRQQMAQLVTDVLSAKLILALLVLLFSLAIFSYGSGGTKVPLEWLPWTVCFICAFGFSPVWYFIGIERMMTTALLDLGLRTAGLLVTILTVSSPRHAERVLMIQACVGVLNTLIPSIIMIRRTGMGPMRIGRALHAIRESWELFLYKGAQNIMGSIASTLIGYFGGPSAVGAFVPAEKVVRAATGFISTALNAAFPHLVRQQFAGRAKARQLVTVGLFIMLTISVLFAASVTVLAPMLVHLVFGHGYDDAIYLLKLLVWIVPLRACSMTISVLWMIPSGHELLASRAMVFNVLLIGLVAAILVPRMQGAGMAVAFSLAEITMFSVLVGFFLKVKS